MNRCSTLTTARAGKEDKLMKILKIFGKILAVLFGIAFAAFAATQAVYWLNLDNKVIFLLYKLLHKHYDKIDATRDRHF